MPARYRQLQRRSGWAGAALLGLALLSVAAVAALSAGSGDRDRLGGSSSDDAAALESDPIVSLEQERADEATEPTRLTAIGLPIDDALANLLVDAAATGQPDGSALREAGPARPDPDLPPPFVTALYDIDGGSVEIVLQPIEFERHVAFVELHPAGPGAYEVGDRGDRGTLLMSEATIHRQLIFFSRADFSVNVIVRWQPGSDPGAPIMTFDQMRMWAESIADGVLSELAAHPSSG